jgi:hypothetical protein
MTVGLYLFGPGKTDLGLRRAKFSMGVLVGYRVRWTAVAQGVHRQPLLFSSSSLHIGSSNSKSYQF